MIEWWHFTLDTKGQWLTSLWLWNVKFDAATQEEAMGPYPATRLFGRDIKPLGGNSSPVFYFSRMSSSPAADEQD